MKNKPRNSDIVRLKRTLRRLKRENRTLQKRLLYDSKGITPTFEAHSGTPSEMRFRSHAKNRTLYRKSSFFGYLAASLRSSLLYELWMKIYTVFRRYRLVILSSELLLFLITFLQSSAVFLFLSALSAVLLPAFFVVMLVLSQITARKRKAEKRLLESALTKCNTIAVFPLTRKAFSERETTLSTLLSAFTRSHPSTVLLVISPYFFSKRGIGVKQSRYAAVRAEAERIFLLRTHFYFGIRKQLNDRYCDRLTVFY